MSDRALARAKDVRATRDQLVVDLVDGRTISVPLAWFPRLRAASRKHLSNFELLGRGIGIHWPDLDEDLGVAGLLAGNPAPGR